jgi:hypothetical protein
VEISRRLPTARAYFRAFDGWVIAPTGDVPGDISGWSDNAPSHLRLSFGVRGERVDVDHRSAEHALRPTMVAADLAWHSLLAGTERFPIELRFERHQLSVPLAGRKRRFTMITCGDFATALATFDGCAVQISAQRGVLETISLRKVGEQELGRWMSESATRRTPA